MFNCTTYYMIISEGTSIVLDNIFSSLHYLFILYVYRSTRILEHAGSTKVNKKR